MTEIYLPTYDISDWRVGFEVEMLFGDLGMERYADRWGDAFDRASIKYCRDIAARLSEVTGEKWRGLDEPPAKTGFYVVPEYDLDPISFPNEAVGGVELITPPLKMKDAEEIRTIITDAVLEIEGGFVDSIDNGQGWHVNVDRGQESRGFDAPYALCGMWEGGDTELDILLLNGRYQTRYAAPQHHSYGPSLIEAVRSPMFPMDTRNLSNFLCHHSGKSKRYATNFGKLDRGYLELRHYGLADFMGLDSMETLYGSIFRALTIAPSNSGPFIDRLYERFSLLAEWTNKIAPDLRSQTRTASEYSLATEGRLLFKDEPIAEISWMGVGEVSLIEDEDPNSVDRIMITTGVDAHEIVPSLSLLALDAIYGDIRCGHDFTSSSNAFNDQILSLSEKYQSAGLLPSEDLLDKMLVRSKG